MMDPFYRGWFAGWTRGMARLNEEQRSAVFSECGRACAAPEILPLYRRLLAAAPDADAFFRAVDAGVEGVAVDAVEPGASYDFLYARCCCPLHTDGGVDDPLLCECSRESLLWLMRSLFPERRPRVEMLESVLAGDGQCRLRVWLNG